MSEAAVLLLVAVSARALAAAARRAGYEAVAIDAFGDRDARALCREMRVLGTAMGGFAKADLEPVVAELCAAHRPAGIVYGSGFDDCPELLAPLARHAPLVGDPQSLSGAKDPRIFAQACLAAGLPHPSVRFDAAEDAGWLVKRQGGSGGLHIAPAVPGRPLGRREYAQRRVEGRAVSLLFVRDASALTCIAWSEQWAAPCADAPYRYGGAAGPLDFEPPPDLPLRLAALTAALGVRGLASADFIDDGETLWLLEINPRPGATLDLFDSDDDPLLARHIDAQSYGPAKPAPARAPAAAEIVYAQTDAVAPAGDWPDWAVDRPAVGTPIPAGAPFCTVTARAASTAQAKKRLRECALRMQSWLAEGSP